MSSETEKNVAEQPNPKPDVNIHPDYNGQDSDLVLVSSDGQQFLVHSLIMKLASGMFKAMIEASPTYVSNKEPIHVQEGGAVITDLLGIIYPNNLSLVNAQPTFEHFRDICYAAEKYEMAGALRVLRCLLRMNIDIFPPLLAFALASRYQWPEELRLASTATLKLDLFSPQPLNGMQLLPSDGLLKIMGLHRRRKNILVESLDLDNSGRTYPIQWCSVQLDKSWCGRPSKHFDTPRWAVLKYRISEEMERKPDGSSIRDDAFWNRTEFNKIWEIECPGICVKGGGATYKIMDKHKLKTQVVRILDSLPTTI